MATETHTPAIEVDVDIPEEALERANKLVQEGFAPREALLEVIDLQLPVDELNEPA